MRIRTYETVDSTLDEAKRLFQAGRLALWDSILADRQSAGRGQQGRSWVSDKGNLMSAVRLPLTPPFCLPCAPLALSLVYCEALRESGFDCYLKWPNDLVVKTPAGYGKCSGTLLERKGELLVAGTGINIVSAPGAERMREGAVMPAACLAQSNPMAAEKLTPQALWLKIMQRLTALDTGSFARSWHERASALLLWQGRTVRFHDGQSVHEGILSGIGSRGELVLGCGKASVSFLSGTLLPPEQ